MKIYPLISAIRKKGISQQCVKRHKIRKGPHLFLSPNWFDQLLKHHCELLGSPGEKPKDFFIYTLNTSSIRSLGQLETTSRQKKAQKSQVSPRHVWELTVLRAHRLFHRLFNGSRKKGILPIHFLKSVDWHKCAILGQPYPPTYLSMCFPDYRVSHKTLGNESAHSTRPSVKLNTLSCFTLLAPVHILMCGSY